MSSAGDALAKEAERLIGTPFRLHGRSPETGVDCVGLVSAAFNRIDRRFDPPAHYALRNRTIAPFLERLEQAPARRLASGDHAQQTGDICLCTLGSGQHHVVILAGPAAGRAVSFIHAHAGLRRVVRTPGLPPWPVLTSWRP